MKFRPATNEEIAEKYVGRKASFEHGIVEGARLVRGKYITTHRTKTTAMIQQDENGIFAMRKGNRETLKATMYFYENCKPFVASLRATYLK